MPRSTVRVVSPEEKAHETEFYRRLNDPRVEKRYVGPDTIVLHHHQLGEVGSKTEIRRRGKVTSVLYVLPRIPTERLAAFGNVRRKRGNARQSRPWMDVGGGRVNARPSDPMREAQEHEAFDRHLVSLPKLPCGCSVGTRCDGAHARRSARRGTSHGDTQPEVPAFFNQWRERVEKLLVRRYEADGMASAPARDVAANVVARAMSNLKKMYSQGRLADDAAAGLYDRGLRQARR